jgi:CubicO group peptidase (beta-lactamase class C family)
LKQSLAAGIASFPSPDCAEAPFEEIRPGARAAVQAAAAAFMAEFKIPGLAVAIARNGRIVYAQGFGLADTHTGEAVTPAHLFRIASVSKPVTR